MGLFLTEGPSQILPVYFCHSKQHNIWFQIPQGGKQQHGAGHCSLSKGASRQEAPLLIKDH